jgi:mycofactocin glycosyltransferase
MVSFARTELAPDPVRPAPSPATPYPVGWRLAPDRDLVVLAEGRVLLGGSPTRLVRLRPKASRLVRGWLDGGQVENDRTARAVARRLVRAGLVHPRPAPGPAGMLVTMVVPVRDRAAELERLLASVGRTPTIVVDDGSLHGAPIEKVARDAGAEYLRLDTSRGPGGARNAGLAKVRTPFVAMVDSDCVLPPGWLDELVGHFGDPRVALVAPRVVSPDGPSALARYESARCALDLGPDEGPVAPGRRVGYVPSAAIVLRRAAVLPHCFDERLAVGEDVDLVWRLVEAGWDIRYVPSVEVEHEPRLQPLEWAARRFLYGSSAGPLARRHGDATAPARLSPATAAVWGLALSGRLTAAAGVGAVSTALLAGRLKGVVDDPFDVAARLTGVGMARSAGPIVAGMARAWTPAIVVGLFVRRLRRRRLALLAALGISAAQGWRSRPEGLDPLSYLSLRLADDLAYGLGVWWGCAREATVTPLVPAIVRPRRPKAGAQRT